MIVMLLRFLLSLLNPYKLERLPRRKSFWLRYRIVIFTFCVKRLLRRYRQYAYYDGIDLGTVKIIHSCRDEEFETWLKKIGEDTKPHLTKKSIATIKTGFFFKALYNFFQFNRQLIVYSSGKALVINRSSQLSVNHNIKGTLNISDDTDILLRTEFKSVIKSQNTVKVESKREPIKEKPGKGKEKVSLGKPSINITPPVTEPPVIVNPPMKVDAGRRMRGVEVDETF